MKIRGVEFGPVLVSSGSRGFFGKLAVFAYGAARKNAQNITYVTDTTVAASPKKAPSKRKIEFGAGVLLETGRAQVELAALFRRGILQKISEPFLISFAFASEIHEERKHELETAVEFLQKEKKSSVSSMVSFGLLLHLGIWNGSTEEVREVRELLSLARSLEVPVVLALSVLVSPDTAGQFVREGLCDALAVSEPIAWDDIPEHVREVFFRIRISPLAEFGGGFVSGKYLAPLVSEWAVQVRRQGIRAPIIALHCALRPKDIATLQEAGISGIALDAALALRPWNVRRMLHHARELFQFS